LRPLFFLEVTMYYSLFILFFVLMFVGVAFGDKIFPRYTNYK